jgi:hypothetical protein
LGYGLLDTRPSAGSGQFSAGQISVCAHGRLEIQPATGPFLFRSGTHSVTNLRLTEGRKVFIFTQVGCFRQAQPTQNAAVQRDNDTTGPG